MAAPLRHWLAVLLLGSGLLGGTSCSRAKHYAQEAFRTAADPLFRNYDSTTPDTRFNRKRFEEHLGLPCPADVQQLYCYADEFGIDSKYLFSFTCRPTTFQHLVTRNALRADSVRVGSSGLLQPFAWWPAGAEHGLTAYWRSNREQWFQYLWYDANQQRAYYLEYTL